MTNIPPVLQTVANDFCARTGRSSVTVKTLVESVAADDIRAQLEIIAGRPGVIIVAQPRGTY